MTLTYFLLIFILPTLVGAEEVPSPAPVYQELILERVIG